MVDFPTPPLPEATANNIFNIREHAVPPSLRLEFTPLGGHIYCYLHAALASTNILTAFTQADLIISFIGQAGVVSAYSEETFLSSILYILYHVQGNKILTQVGIVYIGQPLLILLLPVIISIIIFLNLR